MGGGNSSSVGTGIVGLFSWCVRMRMMWPCFKSCSAIHKTNALPGSIPCNCKQQKNCLSVCVCVCVCVCTFILCTFLGRGVFSTLHRRRDHCAHTQAVFPRPPFPHPSCLPGADVACTCNPHQRCRPVDCRVISSSKTVVMAPVLLEEDRRRLCLSMRKTSMGPRRCSPLDGFEVGTGARFSFSCR